MWDEVGELGNYTRATQFMYGSRTLAFVWDFGVSRDVNPPASQRILSLRERD